MEALMQKICEELAKAGVDMEVVMKRFMKNEASYIKFLLRFKEDESFQNMQNYYTQGNLEEAFKAAHTLKGLTANLGLDAVMGSLIPITEKLRAGSHEGLKELMEQAEKEYVAVIKILES